MITKEDKDGQIKLLRDALEKIKIEIDDLKSLDEWIIRDDVVDNINRIVDTALLDTTF